MKPICGIYGINILQCINPNEAMYLVENTKLIKNSNEMACKICATVFPSYVTECAKPCTDGEMAL